MSKKAAAKEPKTIKKTPKEQKTNKPDNENIVVVPPKKEIKGFLEKIVEDERKSRGKAQRIFLILTHEYNENELERKYEVMGTTGNVYTVIIKNKPSCTCPDHTNRYKRCKHIYFVLTRIMKVKPSQEDISTYDDEDLIDMFNNIPQITENLRINSSQLAKFKELKKNGNGEVEMRVIDEDDICAICLGELYECNEEIVYCKYSCGHVLHKQCFDMYNSKRTEIKCLFCYKIWETEKKQYINLD